VAALAERVRAGRVDLDRVRLAAYCGHEVARGVVAEPIAPDDFEGWVRGLEAWGAEVALRGYVLAAERDATASARQRAQAHELFATVIRHADANGLGSDVDVVEELNDFMLSQEGSEEYDSPHWKVVILVLHDLAHDLAHEPRWLSTNDAERLRATQRMQERLDWTGGRVRYERTVRAGDGWMHQFTLLETGGTEQFPREQPAASDWTPPADSARCPPSGRGIFSRYTFGRFLTDPTAQARARHALAEWALS
jgi:hypothetical protein